jgi:hypothetical protein
VILGAVARAFALLLIVGLSLASSLSGKEKKSITVTAVRHDSQLYQRTSTYQTLGHSDTNCSTTTTTVGNTTTGNADCSTTTSAPQNHEMTVSRLDVVARSWAEE